MTLRMLALVVAVVLVACFTRPVLADDPPAAENITRIVKFVSAREGAAGGKPALMVRVSSKFGGSPIELAVPNTDPAAMKLNADPAMERVVKAAKAGDFLKTTYVKVQTRLVLSQLEAYTPRPGEVDPEAYEFVKTTEVKSGEQTYQAIVANKMDKEQTLLVPLVKGADGTSAAEAEIVAQIARLKAGDFADAQTVKTGNDTFLKWIFPYQAPQSGTYVKLANEKTESGVTESVVTLKKGSDSITATVRPAKTGGPADPAILAKTRGLQANTPVVYKAVADGGKTWLLDIKADSTPMPAGDVTLNGTFTTSYKRGQDIPLKVVLKPTGPGEWSAVYNFAWNGAPKTYTGTVKGDLKNGDVSGTGSGDNKKFVWEGKSQNGVVTFNHFELAGDRRSPTGSATMR